MLGRSKKSTVTLTERFPPTSTPDARPKILVLILDHYSYKNPDKTQHDWSDRKHQAFLEEFKDAYQMIASAPATAELFIRSKKADIIFVIGATRIGPACNVEATVSCLVEFATRGGTVIFSGVPWGFNPSTKPKDRAVFKNIFSLDWQIGTHMNVSTKRIVDACTLIMPMIRTTIKGTYLKNVDDPWGLYRVCEDKADAGPPKKAQSAVVWQSYGKGFVGYIGHDDFASEDAVEIFHTMCAAATCHHDIVEDDEESVQVIAASGNGAVTEVRSRDGPDMRVDDVQALRLAEIIDGTVRDSPATRLQGVTSMRLAEAADVTFEEHMRSSERMSGRVEVAPRIGIAEVRTAIGLASVPDPCYTRCEDVVFHKRDVGKGSAYGQGG